MNPQVDPLAGGDVPVTSPSAASNVTLSLGEMLRQAREHRGLTLDEVARHTRLPKRHLESLEQNNLAALPPGPYRRGEVIAYAEAVGLDSQLALASLAQALRLPTMPTEVRVQKLAPVRERRAWNGRRMLTGGVLVVGVLAGGWTLLRQSNGFRGAPSPQNDEVPARPPSSEPDARPAGSSGVSEPGGSSLPSDAAGIAVTTPTPPADRSDTPQTFDYPALIVVTDPPGARITVDGVSWGESPVTIRSLPPAARRVRATLDGYASQERTVNVSGASPRTTVRLTLKPGR